MGSETLGEIIKAISDRWNLWKNAEITLEANPSSAEKNKFIEFKQNGVTRLSFARRTFLGTDAQRRNAPRATGWGGGIWGHCHVFDILLMYVELFTTYSDI